MVAASCRRGTEFLSAHVLTPARRRRPGRRRPWFVSVQTASSGFHFCGGSLIRRDVVVTAASAIKVVVGARDLDSATSGTELNVLEIVVHPLWVSSTNDNDIALLKLDGCMPVGSPTIRWDDRAEAALFADFGTAPHDGLAAIIGSVVPTATNQPLCTRHLCTRSAGHEYRRRSLTTPTDVTPDRRHAGWATLRPGARRRGSCKRPARP